MRYCRSTKTEERPVKYFLNDTQIEDVNCFKYLEILPDCRLNFHQHIDKVKNKSLQFWGVFFQLRKFLTEILYDNKIYTVREIFAYEILKLTGKIIQKDCQVETLRYSITEQKMNVIFTKQKKIIS